MRNIQFVVAGGQQNLHSILHSSFVAISKVHQLLKHMSCWISLEEKGEGLWFPDEQIQVANV